MPRQKRLQVTGLGLRSKVYTSNLGQFYQLVKSLLVAKVAQGKFLKEELEVDLDLWMSILLDVGNGLEFTI